MRRCDKVGKKTDGVGREVGVSGVHGHGQQEHCNDDCTHTNTRRASNKNGYAG